MVVFCTLLPQNTCTYYTLKMSIDCNSLCQMHCLKFLPVEYSSHSSGKEMPVSMTIAPTALPSLLSYCRLFTNLWSEWTILWRNCRMFWNSNTGFGLLLATANLWLATPITSATHPCMTSTSSSPLIECSRVSLSPCLLSKQPFLQDEFLQPPSPQPDGQLEDTTSTQQLPFHAKNNSSNALPPLALNKEKIMVNIMFGKFSNL